MSDYTHEEKEELARKISKIKTKKHLETIRDIIIGSNPNLSMTNNANGLFMCFHNLTQVTYKKLNKFIKETKDTTTSATKPLSEISEPVSEYVPYSCNEYPYEGNSKLRYSNREKNIIKRKLYDTALNNDSATDDIKLDINSASASQQDCTSSDDNINKKPKVIEPVDSEKQSKIFIKKKNYQ